MGGILNRLLSVLAQRHVLPFALRSARLSGPFLSLCPPFWLYQLLELRNLPIAVLKGTKEERIMCLQPVQATAHKYICLTYRINALAVRDRARDNNITNYRRFGDLETVVLLFS